MSAASEISVADAVVVTGPASDTDKEIAAAVLVDEIERRSGLRLPVQERWPADGRTVISLSTLPVPESWPQVISSQQLASLQGRHESYALTVTTPKGRGPVVAVAGTDRRGLLYGVGRLLRVMRLAERTAGLESPMALVGTPEFAIRGHQLGYRALANTYDAWTPQQYEQYIRELIVFGTNSIESIPFEDSQPSGLMPIPRDEMNRILSEICAKYDLDHWAWTPADFSLADEALRSKALAQHEAFYRTCPRLDGVFFPGGDPGSNPPELVIPYLESLARLLTKHHPAARIWLSLQGFDEQKAAIIFDHLQTTLPTWLGGLVAGPGSPPIEQTRRRLPRQYQLRWYPDISHTVRCQYPVRWWDPAFALTLGREPPNPRPVDYERTFQSDARYTNGFLTYSEGINDDVNKIVWSLLGWDSRTAPRTAVTEYCRFFFGADAAEPAADALLGLERNWHGDLAGNATVAETLAAWQALEKRTPRLLDNWRFQLCLLRAYYDAYTRRRLIRETKLEQAALAQLDQARTTGADLAIRKAMSILQEATEHSDSAWRERIMSLTESLYHSVGFQTSLDRYHASGPERGCILDSLDHPLNNRWWLEDEFVAIRNMPSEEAKLSRLDLIRSWDRPGAGSFYDDIGHVGRSPHVREATDAESSPAPEFAWRDEGKCRDRLSWQDYMRWPGPMEYKDLDPGVSYTIRVTGQGDCIVRANGVLLKPMQYSRKVGEFKCYPVPPALTAERHLTLTWDDIDESRLHWRRRSHVAEVWLLKSSSPGPQR